MLLVLVQSRKFWLTFLTLIVIVVQAFNPLFQLPVEDLVAMIVIEVAFVIALAYNPGDLQSKLTSMLTDKAFWAALFGIAIILMQIFIPSFTLDTVKLIALCIALVPYILGVAFDPGDPASKLVGLIRSRKFWETLIGIVVVILAGFNLVLPFGLTDIHVVGICLALASLVTGQAIEGAPVIPIVQLGGGSSTE